MFFPEVPPLWEQIPSHHLFMEPMESLDTVYWVLSCKDFHRKGSGGGPAWLARIPSSRTIWDLTQTLLCSRSLPFKPPLPVPPG